MRTIHALFVAQLLSTLAGAATIDVFPGPGALQAAIDAASPGDTLRVHKSLSENIYSEAVTIDKRLRLIGDGPQVVSIVAPCTTAAALTVAADHVLVRDIRVGGGTAFAVDIENRDRVTVKGILAEEACGTEEYGINIYQSTNITLRNNTVQGAFADAGIYLGGIAAGARARAVGNSIALGNRGLIVEDSLPPVIVRLNEIRFSTTDGIFLHNSDGVFVRRNEVTLGGGNGIHLDSTSDGNQIMHNLMGNNLLDVLDEGTGNCWRGNTFTTGTPPSGC